MTRRAKLSLVSSKQNVDKQSASLDSDVADTWAKASRKKVKQAQQNDSNEVSEGFTPGLNGKVFFKVAILVGVTVAALAVYLYRHRFR